MLFQKVVTGGGHACDWCDSWRSLRCFILAERLRPGSARMSPSGSQVPNTQSQSPKYKVPSPKSEVPCPKPKVQMALRSNKLKFVGLFGLGIFQIRNFDIDVMAADGGDVMGRQKDCFCPSCFDRVNHTGDFVSSEIIHPGRHRRARESGLRLVRQMF